LEEVIEGNPNSAEAWYELAKIHHHQGETDQREICIEHVIKLKPEWTKFTKKLRVTPVITERTKPIEVLSKSDGLEVDEEPSFPYPYEMLDALINSVLKDLLLSCEQGSEDGTLLLPRSGFDADDALRILTLAAAKGRKEEAYTGLIAYLKLRPQDDATWKVLLSLADTMGIEESIEAASEALRNLKEGDIFTNVFWDRFPTVEIPEREHPDPMASDSRK
ncbi:MAG: tetratricopeptide repeat protein, partial [Candidatus Thorarchaeota archaeon]|nr:tetratricopeptide repeat protein [Candidatus Thorarchaeota archaeon]